jgi:c-di-GMP-binding flagellar brake protein YcgR
MERGMIERRQSIRVECELPSRFRNLDSGFSQKISEAVVKNISRGGVCLRVDEFIPIQCHLHFYLTLPDHQTLEVRLAPAWIVELPHLGKYEIGARFVEMSAEQEDAIQSYEYQVLLERMPARQRKAADPQKDAFEDPGLAA